jgi:uncharacterized PurR-regulated membrane protein YhhQ (DUF165 family)
MKTSEYHKIVKEISNQTSKEEKRKIEVLNWALTATMGALIVLISSLLSDDTEIVVRWVTLKFMWAVMFASVFCTLYIVIVFFLRPKSVWDKKFEQLSEMVETDITYDEAMKQLELLPKQKSNEC